ncbi:ABC transporter permease [Fodinibius sediminis]|uniref:ABC-type transport system, involved in lipoprotein release, permease component n=1 Tax=Fodinibius sediminis TaxID=1214077 RepID=A0A521BXG1_9BACT|nr:FtsX-like permease family protein [Fodinibius sediminis]SMO51873.1 ABC-type transport system, involved in lipoprotein release, permease component [Fodinibius sediminis]
MIANIIKLGWKNIWRNTTRSAVVITAVLLGTWAGVFLSAFFTGMVQSYLDNQFKLTVPHIELTHPQFKDLYRPEYSIPGADTIISDLRQRSFVEKVSAQSLASGLAQSARNSYGVTIHGILPGRTHGVNTYLKEGTMPGNDQQNPVLVGSKLAERLGLEPDSRVVLNFQDAAGNITGGAFRVVGIFDSFSSVFDETNVFVTQSDLNQLMEVGDQVHRLSLTITDFSRANSYAQQLRTEFPNLRVTTWGEAAPELQYSFQMTDLMMYIVMVIIIIALVFSIINTMLMAVLERTRELGMLRAIGMNKTRVFAMVVWETVFLTMVGTPVGLFLSWLTISYFGHAGIDLGAFSEGLNAYGLGAVVYPGLPPGYYFNITLLIACAALLSALYPAWKTLQLNPVEAIRKIN